MTDGADDPKNDHLDDELAAIYSTDPCAMPDRAAAEAHLAACAPCRLLVDTYRDLDAAFRSGETWRHAEELSGTTGRREAALSVARKMDEEDAAAAKLLRYALGSPARFRLFNLNQPAARNAGVVRLLIKTARALHEREPKFSAALATAATQIAQSLPADATTPRQLALAQSYREQGNAFRYLGRFNHALAALDAAEKLFTGEPGADAFDQATVLYIRAIVHLETERIPEAIDEATRAAQAFDDYGDEPRAAAARMVRAACLAMTGRPREAAEMFEKVAEFARAQDDAPLEGRALSNAGRAYVYAGEPARATSCYAAAVQLYDEVGLVTERARAEWSLGSAEAARGMLKDAAPQLKSASAELARLGLTNDAALATLEWAEVMLALGSTAGVRQACAGIVTAFASEGMQNHARRALAVVNEALRAGRATPDLVRGVRQYLENLPSAPDEPFRTSNFSQDVS